MSYHLESNVRTGATTVAGGRDHYGVSIPRFGMDATHDAANLDGLSRANVSLPLERRRSPHSCAARCETRSEDEHTGEHNPGAGKPAGTRCGARSRLRFLEKPAHATQQG